MVDEMGANHLNIRNAVNQNVRVSRIIGAKIYNTHDEDIGQIADIVVQRHNGEACYAIMSLQDYLDTPDLFHPIPWDKLVYSTHMNGYILDAEKEHLQNAPKFKSTSEPEWNDDNYIRQVDDYYNLQLSS